MVHRQGVLHLPYAFMCTIVGLSRTALPAQREKAFCNIFVSSWMCGQVLQSSAGQQMAKICGSNYAPAQSSA